MNFPEPTDVTGIVLAGGRARRMEGQDKGLLLHQGRPLIEHVCERLQPQVARLCINANHHAEIYGRYGYPVFADQWPDYPGPLAGFYSALQQCESKWFCFVPCDTPYLPDDLVERLCAAARLERVPLVSVSDGQRLQGTVCLLHRSCESALQSYYEQGKHRVQEWIRSQPHTVVDYADQSRAFLNINEPQQLDT